MNILDLIESQEGERVQDSDYLVEVSDSDYPRIECPLQFTDPTDNREFKLSSANRWYIHTIRD